MHRRAGVRERRKEREGHDKRNENPTSRLTTLLFAKHEEKTSSPSPPGFLQNDTAPARPSPLIARNHSRPRSSLEHVIDALARQAAALEILPRANGILHVIALLPRGEAEALLAHLLLRGRVLAEVLFQRHQDQRYRGAALARLLGPFVLYVF